jgi:hypothetical protein
MKKSQIFSFPQSYFSAFPLKTISLFPDPVVIVLPLPHAVIHDEMGAPWRHGLDTGDWCQLRQSA